MKQYLLALLIPFTMCASATEETLVFEMECSWVNYSQDGTTKKSEDSQAFSVYKSNATQILKIAPAKNSSHMPPPTYTMKVKGAHSRLNSECLITKNSIGWATIQGLHYFAEVIQK